MARVTIRRINDALLAAGFRNTQLVKGNGYWYFTEFDYEAKPEPSTWHSSGVYVYRLGSLTIEQWIQEARNLRDYV